MPRTSLFELVGDTDIYLLDQIIKGRYGKKDRVLDAGCGNGRNLHWFLKNNIPVYGNDHDPDCIYHLKSLYPSLPAERLQPCALEKLPYGNGSFDHIICSAVLHFASNTNHFYQMMAEMVRVLKKTGTLFIRMTSNIGIEEHVQLIGNGLYHLPDGSTRFLLTRSLLAQTLHKLNLHFVEPFKTVNVNDIRCMSTLLLQPR